MRRTRLWALLISTTVALLSLDVANAQDSASPQLVLEGARDVPEELVAQRRRERAGTRVARLLDAAPEGRGVYIATRFDRDEDLALVTEPGGARTQLGFGKSDVVAAAACPDAARRLVAVARARADGATEVSLVALAAGTERALGAAFGAPALVFAPAGDLLAFAGAGPDGARAVILASTVDAKAGAEPPAPTPLALPGDGFRPLGFSPDGRRLLLERAAGDGTTGLHVADLATSDVLAIGGAAAAAVPGTACFVEGGAALLFAAAGDRLVRRGIAEGDRREEHVAALGSRVRAVATDRAAARIAVVVDEAEGEGLHVIERATGAHRRIEGLPAGRIGAVRFAADGRAVALEIETPATAGDVWQVALDAEAAGAAVARMTESEAGGVPVGRLAPPETSVVDAPGRDEAAGGGRTLRGLLHARAGDPPGTRHPVLIRIVETAPRPVWNPLRAHLVAARGFAVLEIAALSPADLESVLAWVGARPDLDADRVALLGAGAGAARAIAFLALSKARLRGAVALASDDALAGAVGNAGPRLLLARTSDRASFATLGPDDVARLDAAIEVFLGRVLSGEAAAATPTAPAFPPPPEAAPARRLGTLALRLRADVSALAFAPGSGALAAGGAEGELALFDPATGEARVRTGGKGKGDAVTALAWDAKGARLVALAGGAVAVVDGGTLAPIAKLEGIDAGYQVSAVALSPDGATVAAATTDGLLRTFDAATGKPRAEVDSRRLIPSVAFSPDGARIASGDSDGVVHIHDVAKPGKPIAVSTFVECKQVVFVAADKVAVASADAHVRIIDVAKAAVVETTPLDATLVLEARRLPGARRLLGSGGGHVRIVDGEKGAAAQQRERDIAGGAAALSADGLRAAVGAGRAIRIVDATSGETVVAGAGHTQRVAAVAWSPDGARIASGGDDGALLLWTAAASEAVPGRVVGSGARVAALAFAPDGTLLAGGDDGRVRRIDVAAAAETGSFDAGVGQVFALGLSPDGARLAVVGTKQEVRAVGATTGAVLATYRGRRTLFTTAACSPDGKLLAAATHDRTVRLYDAATGDEVRELARHPGRVGAVAFSPDGKLLATGAADGTTRLFDVATGEPVREVPGHAGAVTAVAFSPDGKLLATASADATARLVDVAAGRPVAALTGAADALTGIAFAPDGRRIAASSRDTTVLIWDVAR